MNTFLCPPCGLSFDSEEKLLGHFRKAHRPNPCFKCAQTFIGPGEFCQTCLTNPEPRLQKILEISERICAFQIEQENVKKQIHNLSLEKGRLLAEIQFKDRSGSTYKGAVYCKHGLFLEQCQPCSPILEHMRKVSSEQWSRIAKKVYAQADPKKKEKKIEEVIIMDDL